MKIANELNKNLTFSLLIIMILSGIIYYFYGHLGVGYKFDLPPEYIHFRKIFEYVLCGLGVIQLLAVYNFIEKMLFNPEMIEKLSNSLEEDKDKLLQKYTSKEVTIIKGSRFALDINFIFVIYGFALAFIGSDTVTFSSFFLLGILVLCVSFLRINSKAKKHFK